MSENQLTDEQVIAMNNSHFALRKKQMIDEAYQRSLNPQDVMATKKGTQNTRSKIYKHRLILQLLSGQKVYETESSIPIPDLGPQNLSKSFLENQKNLQNPKLGFLNKWDDVVGMSPKSSKMMLLPKIVKRQEKYLEKLSEKFPQNSGKQKLENLLYNTYGAYDSSLTNSTYIDESKMFNSMDQRHLDSVLASSRTCKSQREKSEKMNMSDTSRRFKTFVEKKEKHKNRRIQMYRTKKTKFFKKTDQKNEKNLKPLGIKKVAYNDYMNKFKREDPFRMFESSQEHQIRVKQASERLYRSLEKKSEKCPTDPFFVHNRHLDHSIFKGVNLNDTRCFEYTPYFKELVRKSKYVRAFVNHQKISNNTKRHHKNYKSLIRKPKDTHRQYRDKLRLEELNEGLKAVKELDTFVEKQNKIRGTEKFKLFENFYGSKLCYSNRK